MPIIDLFDDIHDAPVHAPPESMETGLILRDPVNPFNELRISAVSAPGGRWRGVIVPLSS